MAVVIDDGLLERLVVNQLAEHIDSSVTVLVRGEPEPTPDAAPGDSVGQWCRVLDVSRTAMSQQAGDKEPHKVAGIITINCGASVNATRSSPYAIKACMANVAKAIARKCLIDEDSGHEMTTGEATCSADSPDDQRSVATGVVTVPFLAVRTSGDSIEEHP